jgi:hypothetical protein
MQWHELSFSLHHLADRTRLVVECPHCEKALAMIDMPPNRHFVKQVIH